MHWIPMVLTFTSIFVTGILINRRIYHSSMARNDLRKIDAVGGSVLTTILSLFLGALAADIGWWVLLIPASVLVVIGLVIFTYLCIIKDKNWWNSYATKTRQSVVMGNRFRR